MTIAVIGAGPGLGFSLAKTFGRHGFRIAMVSRTQEKLDQYAEELRNLDIEAKGFVAYNKERAAIKRCSTNQEPLRHNWCYRV